MQHSVSKRGWREIDGKKFYFRSLWEANYARYLSFLKKRSLIVDWDYECKTFWFEGIKRGCVSYLPDFLVKYPDRHEWHEVKGFMDAKSKTKINRFKVYFPQEKLKIIDKNWFKINNPNMRMLIRDWEFGGKK